jgi:hypothetical protein
VKKRRRSLWKRRMSDSEHVKRTFGDFQTAVRGCGLHMASVISTIPFVKEPYVFGAFRASSLALINSHVLRLENVNTASRKDARMAAAL